MSLNLRAALLRPSTAFSSSHKVEALLTRLLPCVRAGITGGFAICVLNALLQRSCVSSSTPGVAVALTLKSPLLPPTSRRYRSSIWVGCLVLSRVRSGRLGDRTSAGRRFWRFELGVALSVRAYGWAVERRAEAWREKNRALFAGMPLPHHPCLGRSGAWFGQVWRVVWACLAWRRSGRVSGRAGSV
jgi:hypothetical protein